jgi:hypothetical protein
LAALLALCLGATFSAKAQAQFRFLFQGTSYQNNGAGNAIGTPITEQDLLNDRAQQLGVDPSSIALVYRQNGDVHGDTVAVMRLSDNAQLGFEFGYYFYDNTFTDINNNPPGRTCITNAPQTEILHIDYVYTLDSAGYVSPNGHSMGCAFTTRRFDSGGNLISVSGPMQWIVNPQGSSSTKVINGTFKLGAPFP